MALSFSSASTYAQNTGATGFDVDQISFLFWFNTSSTDDFQTLFGASHSVPQSIWIHRDVGNGGMAFRYYRSTMRGQWCSNTVSTNEWVCFGVSYDRTSLGPPTMYLRRVGIDLSLQVDSSPDQIRDPDGTIISPDAGYTISDNDFPWIGRIAYVQVWDRILTQGEFETASRRPGSIPRGLILFLGDDKGTDLSGNGRNATLTSVSVGDGPPVSPLLIGAGWNGAFTASAPSGAISGGSDGVASVSGILTGLGALSGTSDGLATLAAVLTGLGALSGSSSGIATVTGNLLNEFISGLAEGLATVSGSLTGLGALSGTSDGIATAIATLGAAAFISGEVAGISTSAGTLVGLGSLSGVIAGQSTVAGALNALGDLAGSSNGLAIVSGNLTIEGYIPQIIQTIAITSRPFGIVYFIPKSLGKTIISSY